MIDITQPKRVYYSHECGLDACPECGGPLVVESCTVMLHAKSGRDEASFITNLTGSHFCERCPAVVFDSEKLIFAGNAGLRDHSLQAYAVLGIVDLDAVPEEKRSMELGTDENPVPLIEFLPPLPGVAGQPSLNDPCPCGSGKKYKRCCGESRSRRRRRR